MQTARPSRARVVGVDVVRGLAILSMFTAHLGNDRDLLLWNGSSWLEAADGRSAAGFALLAGVSAALLSGGSHPYAGTRMRHSRVRVLVRALLLWPLGAAMMALKTPVIVILPTYALLFAAMAGVLHWSQRRLLITAAAVLAVAPPLVILARDHIYSSSTYPTQLVDITVGHFYPAGIWMAYLLVGLAVGRMDLLAPATPRRLIVWGGIAAVAGFGTNAIAMRTIDLSHTLRRALLTSEPHSSSAVELVANIGVVLVVLGLCLIAAVRFPRTVAPVAATGALALTTYCGHLIAIAALGAEVVYAPSNLRLAVFIAVTLVATTVWRTTIGRGPLERVLHEVSTWVADRVVPAGRKPSPATTATVMVPATDQPGER